MMSIAPGEWDWMKQFQTNPFGRNPILTAGGIFSDPKFGGGGVMGTETQGANRDAMMAAAAQLLAGSGYSPTRRSFGELVGRAMMAGQNARAQSLDRAQEGRLREAQIGALEQKGAQAQSPFGSIDPDQFTPESLAKFQATGDYGALVPKAGGSDTADMQNFKFWQSLTPEQQKQFMALQRQPTMPTVIDYLGGKAWADRANQTITPVSTAAQEGEAAKTIKGAEAEGSATGKAKGEVTGGILTKGANAQSVTSLLDVADPLIDAATGSLAGAARDKLAGVFGSAPEGAQAIAQLKVVQAALIQSMPRLEGPQSDADRNLYVEAAGQIGNERTPAAVKKAAVQTVRRIQEKYAERAAGVGGDQAKPQVRKRYNPQTGKIE